MKKPTFILTITAAVIFLSCHKKEGNTRFTELPSSHSHINFKNSIQEDEDYNILTYEYLYNGGGVATGDVNNDGLTDIMFTGNMVSNKLYINKGNLEFEDITGKAGVEGRLKWKTGVVMADVNGDGLLDMYVCYSGPGTDEERKNELYINKGNKNGIPSFTESAKEYGLDAPGSYTTTASFFDMDNDGDLDMFMVNHADMFFNPFFNTEQLRTKRHPKFGNRLYRNDNGHFTDISQQANIDGGGLNFGLSVAVSDVNDDGWPDIYVTNDYDERDFLYLNNHNGAFREVLTKATGHISEFAMGSDIADYNNDAKPDVMVLDMLPEDNHRQKLLKGADSYDKYMMRVNHGFHYQQMRNTLQLNNGVDTAGIPVFSEAGQLAGVHSTDWSWAPLFADFDNDGWKDLFISNGILRDMTNLDFVKYTSGYSADYNKKGNDKKEMWELVKDMPSTKLSNYLFKNNHELGFSNVGNEWGITKKSINNGAAYADLDNDGDLDIVINNLNDEATIYKNNTQENKQSHFVRINLKGEGGNKYGIGAKLYIKTASGQQMQEQYLSRGFQSSVDPVMHIGLGSDSIIQFITVKWPGDKISFLENIKADTTISMDEASAGLNKPFEKSNEGNILFNDITANVGINFTHHQSKFVDFKISPLLPYQLSKTGPCLAKGDVNGDGLEDVFIGAAAGYESSLYVQTKTGQFILSNSQPWNAVKDFTNTSAVFFDADKDGDNDLYLVSGGADYPLNSNKYQDRVFENDGQGNFNYLSNALPPETVSGSCAAVTDIDKDGLADLFIGGSCKPGLFPESPESFILKNKSVKGKISFQKDNYQPPILLHAGMVTDAAWLDLNKDGWDDLVLAGQFMPVTIFENHAGRLADATGEYGLSETNGWWRRILAGDFDKDGDVDLIIGNIGNNTQLKASEKEPLSITYGDFYGNGTIEPVLCYYNDGKSYPWFSKDEMADAIPSVNKRFLHYADYADARLTDLFTKEQLAKSAEVSIKITQSVYLQNDGKKKFSIIPLPAYAQMSVVNGLLAADIDQDGNDEIIMAGNYYPFRVQLGPMDASTGMVLKRGKNGYTALPYDKTRLLLNGDVRDIMSLRTAGNDYYIIAANNNGPVQVLKLMHKENSERK